MYVRTYVRTYTGQLYTLHMSVCTYVHRSTVYIAYVCMYVHTYVPQLIIPRVFHFLVDVSATDLRTSLLGPPSPYLRALVKNVDNELEPSTAAEQRKVDPCSLTTNPSWKGVVSARSCEGSGACRSKRQSRKEGA